MKKKRMTSGILASAMMISALSLPMCVFAEDTTEQTDERQVIGTGSYVTNIATKNVSCNYTGMNVKVEWNFTLYDNDDFVVVAMPYHKDADGHSWETTENLLWEDENMQKSLFDFGEGELILGSMGYDGYTGEGEHLDNTELTTDFNIKNAEAVSMYLPYEYDEKDFYGYDSINTVTDFSKSWDNAETFTVTFKDGEQLKESWTQNLPLFSITFHNWENTQFDLAGERFNIVEINRKDGITKDIRRDFNTDAFWSRPWYSSEYQCGGSYTDDDGTYYSHFDNPYPAKFVIEEWNSAEYFIDDEGKRTRRVVYPNGDFACGDKLYDDVVDYNYKYYSDGELVITARLAEGIEDIVLPDKHMDFGMLMGINARVIDDYQNFLTFNAANSIESSVVKECDLTELTHEEISEISDKLHEEGYQALKDILMNKEDFEKEDVKCKWLAVDAEKDTLHAGEELFSYTFEWYGADEVTICHSGTSFKINPRNGGVVNFTASNDSVDGYQNGLSTLEQVDKFCQPHIMPEFVSDSDSEPTTEDTSETTGSELAVTKYGDVDCDGDVSILDVILANRNILGKSTVTKQGAINGDLDFNDSLEPSDSLSIMKLIVGILTEDDLKPAESTEPTEDTTETTTSETTTESAETTETSESTTEEMTTEPEETTVKETTTEDTTETTEKVTEDTTEKPTEETA